METTYYRCHPNRVFWRIFCIGFYETQYYKTRSGKTMWTHRNAAWIIREHDLEKLGYRIGADLKGRRPIEYRQSKKVRTVLSRKESIEIARQTRKAIDKRLADEVERDALDK